MATPCWPAPVSAITRVLPMRLRQQRLAEHVVDLVRAGVVEVLALEQDPRAARVLGEPLGVGQRRRAAGVVALQAVELVEELAGRRGPCRRRRRPRRAPRSAPRARTARRSGRSGRARRARATARCRQLTGRHDLPSRALGKRIIGPALAQRGSVAAARGLRSTTDGSPQPPGRRRQPADHRWSPGSRRRAPRPRPQPA